MDIVLLAGGLGNQMSQYAFSVAKKNKNCTQINTYLLRRESVHHGYELQSVFGIPEESNWKTDFICRFSRKILYLKQKPLYKPICVFILCLFKIFKFRIICERPDYNFDKTLLQHNSGLNIYWGGWHSEKYYQFIEQNIRSLFRFNFNSLNTKSLDLKGRLDKCESVSLHVRRGDYVNKYNKNIFGDVCSIEYYYKAINYIRVRVQNPIFVIFSDDIEWVRKNIKLENCIFVDWNHGKDSWQDMCLMSLCKHNINANSTFSWWGGWLNSNLDKIVIVPKSFISGIFTPDIYPETWIKL